MYFFRIYRQVIAWPLASLFVIMSLPFGTTQAAMVSTDQVMERAYSGAAVADATARERVMDFLKRQDVRDEMQKFGVDPQEAEARANALSNSEIQQLAGKLDQLPAGEGAVGAVVGAVVLVFIVLLVTDLLCFTKVFPFTKCVAK